MTLFGYVVALLEEISDVAPDTRQKLLTILLDMQKSLNLQLKLAAVIDAGEPFVNVSYIHWKVMVHWCSSALMYLHHLQREYGQLTFQISLLSLQNFLLVTLPVLNN